MSIRSLRFPRLSVRLLALTALGAASLLAAGAFGAHAAHADQPGPTPEPRIIVQNRLSITTDRPSYYVDSPIKVCYQVPGRGYIEITDQQGKSDKVLLSGYDDGRGDCFRGFVTPPYGKECLTIRWEPVELSRGPVREGEPEQEGQPALIRRIELNTAQVCFDVLPKGKVLQEM